MPAVISTVIYLIRLLIMAFYDGMVKIGVLFEILRGISNFFSDYSP